MQESRSDKGGHAERAASWSTGGGMLTSLHFGITIAGAGRQIAGDKASPDGGKPARDLKKKKTKQKKGSRKTNNTDSDSLKGLSSSFCWTSRR